MVLCIDEAQTMPRMTLESLRLLSNLETEKRKLLHIVLFGQPELDEMLSTHATRQFRQRIAFAHRLRHLDADEVKSYVEQRLSTAGYRGEPLFTRTALRALYHRSGGTPRLVNILANKALAVGLRRGPAACRAPPCQGSGARHRRRVQQTLVGLVGGTT